MLNRKALQKAFNIINAYWICNNEVIEDATDKEDILNTLAYLSVLIRKVDDKKVSLKKKPLNYGEIREVYAREDDMTFIVCDEYADGEHVETNIINWYYGEPDPKVTIHYIEEMMNPSK